jgi:hypothetical protein
MQWKAVAELWHPQLKNVAGPWDRSYGYDMNKYLSLLALHLWSIIGKDKSSMIDRVSFVFPGEPEKHILITIYSHI